MEINLLRLKILIQLLTDRGTRLTEKELHEYLLKTDAMYKLQQYFIRPKNAIKMSSCPAFNSTNGVTWQGD